MSKISIIVPMYNSEKFISRCVDSILSQSYTDFELILVDDGSTDSTVSICENYAKNDNRILLLKKENGGVSSARNFGLKHAVGELIMFVDSDDSIRPLCLERVAEISDSADFIIFGISFCFLNHSIDTRPVDNLKNYSVTEFLASSELYSYKSSLSSPWARVFKRDIILENNISFNESMSFAEDSLFNVQYLNCCKSVCLDSNCFYNCDKTNENSITHKFIPNYYNSRKIYVEGADIVFSKLMSPENYERFVYEALYNFIGSITYTFQHTTDKKSRMEIIKNICDNEFLNSKTNKNLSFCQNFVLFLVKKKMYSFIYLIYFIKFDIKKSN